LIVQWKIMRKYYAEKLGYKIYIGWTRHTKWIEFCKYPVSVKSSFKV